MKKMFLFAFGLLIFNFGFSQKKQLKPKDIVVYQIENNSDTLSCFPKEMNFQIVEWEFDSCDYYANNFEFEFEIRNNTNQPIICNRNLVCWNDSGFTQPTINEPNKIDPGKTGKIVVQVYPYHQRSRTRTTIFIILQGNQTLEVPLKLKFTNSSVKKCVKT